MISRRRYMGGVKTLPYDAEVEYIESVNRTQKIVTNFIPNTDDLTFTLKFEHIDFTSGDAWAGAWFYAYSGEQTGTYRILKYNRNRNEVRVNNGQLAYGKKLADNIPIVQNTLYDVVIAPDYCTFNNVRYERVDPFDGNVNTGPLQVFDHCLGKFYSLQVEKGGDIVLDLIPVRIGQVGYLYDKVSGTLFGNEGTGAFIVGPDIIMTKESNPEVLAICYANGWAKNENYMTAAEAAAVTNSQLNTTFRKQKIIHFDEFQYFTGITALNNYAFVQCEMSSIKLPNTITTINFNVFFNCVNLEEIEIPDSVTTITNTSQFSGCTSLKKVIVSSNITTISTNMFQNCSNLETLVIDKNTPITTMGTSALQNCTKLKSVTIPSSVTSIGNYFAMGCSSLESVIVYPTTIPTLSGYVPFGGSTCPIYVPAGLVEDYKAAPGWKNYADRIQAMLSSLEESV